MPELTFNVEGVAAAERGLTPLLRFKLRIVNAPADERIQGAMLHAQIQLQPAQRRYSAGEKSRLDEMFGAPERWGQTLRNRLWAHVDATVPPFAGETEVALWVPCTFDLNLAGTKYFYALEDGEVSLLFLFSGTVFYEAPDRRLQMQRVSWEKECAFRFPVRVWHELMARHYPNCAWLYLRQDIFDRVCQFKRGHGLTNWDETMERMLAAAGEEAGVGA